MYSFIHMVELNHRKTAAKRLVKARLNT